jgi:hypothetical protein
MMKKLGCASRAKDAFEMRLRGLSDSGEHESQVFIVIIALQNDPTILKMYPHPNPHPAFVD